MQTVNTKTIIKLFLLLLVLPVASSLLSFISVSVMSTVISKTTGVAYYPDSIQWAFVATCIILVLLVVLVAFLLGLRPIPDEKFAWSRKRFWFSMIFLFAGIVSVITSSLLSAVVDTNIGLVSISEKIGRSPVEIFIFMGGFNVGVMYVAVLKLWLLGRFQLSAIASPKDIVTK